MVHSIHFPTTVPDSPIGYEDAPLPSSRNSQLEVIRPLLRLLRSRGALSPSWLKRASLAQNIPPSHIEPIYKPDANNVQDMVLSNPLVFRCGSNPLPTGDHPLKIELVIQRHRSHCQHCATHCESSSEVHTSCYFTLLLRCLTHGWNPPVDVHNIVPKYATRGNYPTVSQYPKSVHKEITEMIEQGVLRPCNEHSSGITNPIGAQVKNSDKVRSKVLAKVDIVDQASMDLATDRLLRLGSTKVKCRLTLDPSATGVNNASPDAPFRYPSIHDMIDLLSHNCFMALTDIGRYFHTFPLSPEIRSVFRIRYQGVLYEYARCPFGYKLCPYYCSTWSAEFKCWFNAIGIRTAHMVDDWMTVGKSEKEAKDNLTRMEQLLIETGFYLSEKTKLSQSEVLLGVLADTRTMTLRFDPTQCQGMRLILEDQISRIQQDKSPDVSLVRHICGKLNWYAEILQSGRLHISQWWNYCNHGPLHATHKSFLIQDTKWWIAILSIWEKNESVHLSYPILNPAEILREQRSVYILQSDASGTDGYGFYGSYLEEDTVHFQSYSWTDKAPAPGSSHAAELTSLLVAVRQLRVEGDTRPKLVIWITDSMSATYSVNKGVSRKEEGFSILTDILNECDQARFTIIAIWVPREQNEFADFLSHFSYILHRECIKGTAGLEAILEIEELLKGGETTWDVVSKLLRST